MANVAFTATVDNVNKIINFVDNGTSWVSLNGAPTSITIYMKGEDKTSYLVKKVITDSVIIAQFTNSGIAFTFAQLFGADEPVDNYYLVEVIVNEGLATQMLSNKVAIPFTFKIAKLVHDNVLGVHVPVEDLATSLAFGAMPQLLEYLQRLGTNSEYTPDRENKWRKCYNVLNTSINDLTY